ncbi:MAG: regulatory protein RecX [Oleispira antarctica]|uniref:Regulatory protein RecX n=1 Tax=Oleispira antarctica RB-8 TaxID=698738 RepID=R4YPM7_OLEAN|nr:regulatory protein RecX [Oleispira antarctica]MBQ0791809.1 regulatory protein RecX [Oleispira antarctica]CCK77002.1 RecA regulator RecX [Oleispira antarctica RB-8]
MYKKTSGFSKPTELSESELRVAAIGLLSRREYSRHELYQKLIARTSSETYLLQLLDQLIQSGYQSDQRFTESFLRSRINRGLGQMRIERELKEKGIDRDLIEQVFQDEIDWFELAYDCGLRKFRSLDLNDYKERQKAFRYLAYRGFSMDQIHFAIEHYLELQKA